MIQYCAESVRLHERHLLFHVRPYVHLLLLSHRVQVNCQGLDDATCEVSADGGVDSGTARAGRQDVGWHDNDGCNHTTPSQHPLAETVPEVRLVARPGADRIDNNADRVVIASRRPPRRRPSARHGHRQNHDLHQEEDDDRVGYQDCSYYATQSTGLVDAVGS